MSLVGPAGVFGRACRCLWSDLPMFLVGPAGVFVGPAGVFGRA